MKRYLFGLSTLALFALTISVFAQDPVIHRQITVAGANGTDQELQTTAAEAFAIDAAEVVEAIQEDGAATHALLTYTQNRRESSKLNKALHAYRNAEADQDKKKAKDEIQAELGNQYDAFMADQERQIEELEKRLIKLRDQLAKRKEAKSRMVELKLEMVISQAEGLGWPEQNGFDPFMMHGSAAGPAQNFFRFAPGAASPPEGVIPPGEAPRTRELPRTPRQPDPGR